MVVVNINDLPLMLTVEEAAGVLRLSRSVAYELANTYERSNGAEGLPVVRLGRKYRVPRYRLAALLGVPADIQTVGTGDDSAHNTGVSGDLGAASDTDSSGGSIRDDDEAA